MENKKQIIDEIIRNLPQEKRQKVERLLTEDNSTELLNLAYAQLGRQICLRLPPLMIRQWPERKQCDFLNMISVASGDIAEKMVYFTKSINPALQIIEEIYNSNKNK